MRKGNSHQKKRVRALDTTLNYVIPIFAQLPVLKGGINFFPPSKTRERDKDRRTISTGYKIIEKKRVWTKEKKWEKRVS